MTAEPLDSEMLIYQSEDGRINLDVRLAGESVWLSQEQMGVLFGRDRSVITKHIGNIFDEGELTKESNVQNMHFTDIPKPIAFYSLDVIISVGYRVKSPQGVRFRIWATEKLREYIRKGFVIDVDRMKSGSSTNYFDELQERIREIRVSEKIFYQKIKDIYTTSIDYDPKDEKTIRFFQTVQNKLLWAISQHTAAELVAHRVDAALPLLGMTSYDKALPERVRKSDVVTAKNFLTEEEMKELELLVEQYLAFAEAQARRRMPMHMSDWIARLDDILKLNGRELLNHTGKISHDIAKDIAAAQYQIFRDKLRLEQKAASLCELEADLKQLRDSSAKPSRSSRGKK